jgi:hypothetical protein
MAAIPGTGGDDDLTGTQGDDIIDAQAGADRIRDLEGNDVIQPGGGDDLIYLGPGRDVVEIHPNGRDDHIHGFKAGEDTLKFNGFGDLSYADLEPHFQSNPGVSVGLDVSAAAGGTPGDQTLLFLDTFGLGEAEIVFANDPLIGDNPPTETDLVITPIVPPDDRLDTSVFIPIIGYRDPSSYGFAEEPPPAPPPPLPADCNLCNDVVLVPAWD